MGTQKLLPLLMVVAVIAAGSFWWIASREEAVAREAQALPSEARAPSAPTRSADLARPEFQAEESSQPVPAREVVEAAPEVEAPVIREKVSGSRAPRVVRGRVLDREGNPIPGAKIYASDQFAGAIDFDGESSVPWLRRSQAESAEDGTFELEGPKRDTFRVAVRKSGYAPFDRAEIPVPPENDVQLEPFVLAQGAILRGRVVGPGGNGIGGAELSVLSEERGINMIMGDGELPNTVAADGQGYFTIDQLACGPYRILVRSEEHPPRIFEGTADTPGEEISGLRFELEAGEVIAGRVTGIPRALDEDLVVQARKANETGGFALLDFLNTRSVAVEDGSFELRGMEVGARYDLQLRRESDEPNDFFGGSSRSGRVRVESGDRNVLLEYQPEATVAFQVMDSKTREPITELEVHAGIEWPRPVMEGGRPQRSFPDGQVLVGDLRPDSETDRIQIEVRSTGYRTYERSDIAAAAGEDIDLGVIYLDPVPVVRVTVVDGKTGEPVEGARVQLVKEEDSNGFEFRHSISIGTDEDEGSVFEADGSARTDSEGRAELTSLEGERCTLQVRSPDYAPFDRPGIYMTPGEIIEQEVELTPGGFVHVTVLDPDGAPVGGARVAHRPPQKGQTGVMVLGGGFGASGEVTSSDGIARFRNLEAGSHSFKLEEGEAGSVFFAGGTMELRGEDVGAEQEGWSEVAVVEGETSTLTLTTSPRGSLEGQVREGGVILTGANLQLKEDKPQEMAFHLPGMSSSPESRSDGEGRYRFDQVKEGRYVLTVSHSTRAMPVDFEVSVEEGENVFDLNLAVAVIEGQVLDSEGQPIPGVRVQAERAQAEGGGPRTRTIMMISTGSDTVVQMGGGPATETTYTDGEGRYTLRGVQPDVELVVKGEGEDVQPGQSDRVRVAPDEVKRNVDFVLEAGGSILVEAIKADGAPASFQMVRANYEGEDDSVEPKFGFVQTGSTTLTGLRPGPWRVNVSAAGPGGDEANGPPDQVIDVIAGEEAPATFTVD